jgi:hypothetical protein
MKKNLTEVPQPQFETALKNFQKTVPGFSGPFINSAPVGDMFTEPQRQSAWVIGNKTVLLKHENPLDGTVLYYADISLL